MNESFVHLLTMMLTIMEECDRNGEDIEKDTACYRTLYQKKKKKIYYN